MSRADLRLLFASVLVASSLPIGCGDDEPEPEQKLNACDPLTAEEAPITLGDVIAAGRDQNGVIYVLDTDEDGQTRVFVSVGDVLRRRRVAGEGSGSEDGVEFRQVNVDVEPPFTLYYETGADEPRFLRFDSAERVDGGDLSAGEPLELLSADDLSDFELKNLPPDVTVEYFARLGDGRRVVVVRPTDDWSYDDFRVFFGSAQRMFERKVTKVTRARDGGSTTIVFTFDEKPATLRFPVETVDGGFAPGDATLELDGDRLGLELLATDDDKLAELSYYCL